MRPPRGRLEARHPDGTLFYSYEGENLRTSAGTTWQANRIIAAEKNAVRCFVLELAPAYVDVCIKRWQAYTGLAATLEGDGRTFDGIARERVPLVPLRKYPRNRPSKTARSAAQH